MSNGHAPPPLTADAIELHVERLLYGDLRRFRKAMGTPEFQDIFDQLLDRVIEGGVDSVPLIHIQAVSQRLTTIIQEAMTGKVLPAELSTTASETGSSDMPATSP